MARFSREDWLDLGLKQLAKSGPDGLTLERLCLAADKTRGSFYHHFSDHESFLAAMSQHWKELYTDKIIRQVEQVEDQQQRPDALTRLALHLDRDLEREIRKYGQIHETVARVLSETDATRISYMVKLIRENSSASQERALSLARVEYAIFVGAQMTWPQASDTDLLALDQTFKDMLKAYLKSS